MGFGLLCLMVTVQLATLFNIRRQQKREEEFATKAEIARVDNKVETLRSDIVKNGETRRISIEAKVEEARQETRDAAGDLRGKIDCLGSEVAELRGETKMITQALARLEMRKH